MKIIIIGAGIAGFSTYLFLHKHLIAEPNSDEAHTIVIYEAYDIHKLSTKSVPITDPASHAEPVFAPANIGGGIGLSKNGLAAVRRMDMDGTLLNKMYRRGHPIKKWKMSTARGWNVVDVNMDAMKDEAKTYKSLMIARQAAWEVLRDAVLDIDKQAVVREQVTEIIIGENRGQKPTIKFADGTHDEADLVVGADGLRSVARRAMFQDSIDEDPLDWLGWITGRKAKRRDYLTPHYEGLTGLGGFVPSSVLKDKGHEAEAMGITFGPNGFFGCGYITAPSDFDPTAVKDDEQVQPGDLATWWGTFSSPTPVPFPPKKGDVANGKFDQEAALKSLLRRYRSWQDPAIQGVLDYVEIHGVELQYPTYTTPELPTWQRNGNIVLVGDAAHAIQPSSGQGACQAFEDAESLAILLQHYMSTRDSANRDAITKAQSRALDTYVRFRKPRLSMIYTQSQKMSNMKADMNFVEEMLMYFFLWLMARLKLMKTYNNAVLGYDLPAELQRVISEQKEGDMDEC